MASAAVLIAVWITTALLMPLTEDVQPERYRTQQRIQVVRTGLAAGAGVGAAVTVLLAFRRQQHHEVATEQTDHDAGERRITELYTRAVEQLGSHEAPVRLGGLYALERLGQDNPSHRQTIVNVICAYLRMPYNPPADQQPRPSFTISIQSERSPLRQVVSRARRVTRTAIPSKAHTRRRQELQVRLTAQRLLTSHTIDTRPKHERNTTPANTRFWEGMNIDLSHATLNLTWSHFTDLNFRNFHVAHADFSNATFLGNVSFLDATFTDDASFDNATFTGPASFWQATFLGKTSFQGATFADHAFINATYADTPKFEGATFKGGVDIDAENLGYFAHVTFTRDRTRDHYQRLLAEWRANRDGQSSNET